MSICWHHIYFLRAEVEAHEQCARHQPISIQVKGSDKTYMGRASEKQGNDEAQAYWQSRK